MKGIKKEVAYIKNLNVQQRVGAINGSGLRFGIVVSRFNESLTNTLAEEAIRALKFCDVNDKQIELVRVPGAYEIPVVTEKMASTGLFDAFIVLGVVIEGETQHAQMIIDTTGATILEMACRYKIPIINEIVGVLTRGQAEVRCSAGNKSRGWYAGLAAIETAQVLRQIG